MDVRCKLYTRRRSDELLEAPKVKLMHYWNNIRSDQLVKDFIGLPNATTQREIGQFLDGKQICKKNIEMLTCDELMENIDRLWSILFLTGYLTTERNAPRLMYDRIGVVVPNYEMREIFIEKIQKCFQKCGLWRISGDCMMQFRPAIAIYLEANAEHPARCD